MEGFWELLSLDLRRRESERKEGNVRKTQQRRERKGKVQKRGRLGISS